MKKIVIDGIEYEVTEQVSQVLARKFAADAQALEATRGDVAKAKAEADKQTARADAAEAKATAADKARTDAADPARFNAAVAERVELIAKAREIVGTDFKADGLDARAIKVAVITKTDAAFKADGKSDDYIAARYDVAITAKPAEPAPTTTRTDAAAPGAPVDLAARKAKFDAAVKSAHETKAQ